MCLCISDVRPVSPRLTGPFKMYVDPGSACMHNSQYLSIKSQGRYVYFLGTLVCLSRLYFFFFFSRSVSWWPDFQLRESRTSREYLQLVQGEFGAAASVGHARVQTMASSKGRLYPLCFPIKRLPLLRVTFTGSSSGLDMRSTMLPSDMGAHIADTWVYSLFHWMCEVPENGERL